MKDTICVAVGLVGGFYCHFWRLGLCSCDTGRLYGNRLFHRHHHRYDEKVQTHRKRRTFFQSRLVRSGEKSLHFNADRRCSSDGYSAEYQLHPGCCLHQLLPERTAFHRRKYIAHGDSISACNSKSNRCSANENRQNGRNDRQGG